MNSPFLQPIGCLPPDEILFGRTPAMNDARRRLEKLAQTSVPVLIEGESGTGKDMVARWIHRNSPWAAGPYVKINCPAIPATLLESELFGYERGGFTGANWSKPGRVEQAQCGTLFLDEIAELDLGIQAKLLQVLQDGHFCRIGATAETKVEARVICATNRRLKDEVEKGSFRQDLFYRIDVVDLRLLPLRHRATDVPDLLDFFLKMYGEKYNSAPRPFPGPELVRLQSYHWPGNIRELENFVKRYVIVGVDALNVLSAAPGAAAEPDLRLLSYAGDLGNVSLKVLSRRAARQLERQVILESLRANNWNRKSTARALKISYRALLYKIRDSGLVMSDANRWS